MKTSLQSYSKGKDGGEGTYHPEGAVWAGPTYSTGMLPAPMR
jgi:hypothetical protein